MGHGGRLIVDDVHHEILPGWVATVSGAYRVLRGGEGPFVLLNASLGASGASTRQYGADATAPYSAFDVRFGLTAGKTFYDALSAYLGIRAFGGPILWQLRGEDVTGVDRHHYQIAFGVAASLPRGFDLFAEGAPFGERGATVGAGVAF
ncbi:MAG: hypothetical protein IT372_01100 [Polyangiaceae bacterium]|nr:hypothetical protein [Polyangiaceae bacterium]